MYDTYPDAEPRFQKPAGFEDVSFTNQRGLFQRAGKLDHPEPRATIYLLHGQQKSIESHYELAHDLYARKISLRILERSGEGGSQRHMPGTQVPPAFPHEHHVDDVEFFVNHVAPTDRNKPALLQGNCLGGLIGLRTLNRMSDAFDHAVLCAPLLGKQLHRKGDLGRQFATIRPCNEERANRYVLGAHDWNGDEKLNRSDDPEITHDSARYRNMALWPLHYPALRTGGYTYGNLHAIAQSIMMTRAENFAETIKIPVTIVSPTDDTLSSMEEQQKMADRLPQGRLVAVHGARHDLNNESDFWRNQLLAEITAAVQHCETAHARKPATQPTRYMALAAP